MGSSSRSGKETKSLQHEVTEEPTPLVNKLVKEKLMDFKTFDSRAGKYFSGFVLNAGTWVNIPRDDLIKQLVEHAHEVPKQPGLKPTVVVIHPDTANRMLEITIDGLKQEGFEVQVSANVAEGYGYWIANEKDVVVVN